MARFRFALDPALSHRERVEQQRQQRFAAAQRELAQTQAELDRLEAELAERSDAVRTTHGAMRGDELRAAYAYLHALSRAIDDQQVRVSACAADAQRAQAQLVAASRDKQVLATLKQRRRETFEAEAALVEARELDDANARAFGRREVSP